MAPGRWLKSSVHCFSLGATLAVHDQTRGARWMKKTNMIDCRDIIKLRFDLGLTHRQIASSTGVAIGTVANVLKRVTEAGLGHWPLPKDLDETALRARLYPSGALIRRSSNSVRTGTKSSRGSRSRVGGDVPG